jgi:hypothetical protein
MRIGMDWIEVAAYIFAVPRTTGDLLSPIAAQNVHVGLHPPFMRRRPIAGVIWSRNRLRRCSSW